MPDIVADLTKLNQDFARKELEGDVAFFDRHLAAGLRFRRANGTVVDEKEFVKALRDPSNTNERVDVHEIEVLPFGKDLALCSMVIDFKGTRGGKPAEGWFRNTRLFVRREGVWQCAAWFNSKEPRST